MSRMCVVAFFLEVLGNLQLCYSPLVLVKKIEIEIWANKYILTIKFLSLRLVGRVAEFERSYINVCTFYLNRLTLIPHTYGSVINYRCNLEGRDPTSFPGTLISPPQRAPSVATDVDG